LSQELSGRRGDKVTKGLDRDSAREHSSHKSQTCETDVPSGVLVFFSWGYIGCLLPECGADCDYDSDCEANSYCPERDEYGTRIVPGCSGLAVSYEDYCVSRDFIPSSAPSDAPPTRAPTVTGSPTPQPSTSPPSTEICPSSVPDGVREFFGFGPHNCLLPDCGGHCDFDSDCASTSYCHMPDDQYYSRSDSHSLPGCAGMTIDDEFYCVPLEMKPSTEPSMEPSASFAPSNSNQPSLSQSPSYGCDVWEPIGDGIPGEYYGDQSGYSLDMSSDGTIVAIGANYNDGNGPDTGHARVYSFNESSLTWEQLGQDIDGEMYYDRFGTSIALSSDGSILAVGATGNDGNEYASGHVQIYSYDVTSKEWEQKGDDIEGENYCDESGFSLALSANGLVVAIGAPGNSVDDYDYSDYRQGHVRVFYWDEGSWEQLGDDLDGENGGDNSGYSVALSEDGYVLAISAPINDGGFSYGYSPPRGHVRIFSFDERSGTWEQRGDDIDGGYYEKLGESVTLSSDGTIVAIGGGVTETNIYSGGVRVYVYDGSWTQRGNDIDGDSFEGTGYSVSMSSDGNTVSIGAYVGPVRVYTFDKYLDTWTQIGDDIVTTSDGFSFSYYYESLPFRRVALSSDGSTVAFGNVARDFGKGMVRVKKIDRCTPSMSPSVSSPPSMQCSISERELKVEVQTDSKGDEVKWVVKKRNQSMRFKNMKTRGVGLENNDLSTTQMCLKRNHCYRFQIIDSGEDGICCAHGVGYYKVFWRGQLLRKSYFEGKAKEHFKWGKCD